MHIRSQQNIAISVFQEHKTVHSACIHSFMDLPLRGKDLSAGLKHFSALKSALNKRVNWAADGFIKFKDLHGIKFSTKDSS